MKTSSPDIRGWAKIKEAAKYAGVSVRTLRDWLKNGLRHSPPIIGTILVAYAFIDDYLACFETGRHQADEIVDKPMQEL